MKKYLVDLYEAQAADQHLKAPKWMFRTYLAVFPVPLGKTLRIDMVKEFLSGHDIKGKRILDVGCGIGDLSFMLSDQGAGEVIGVELDQHKVDEANKIAKRWNMQHLTFYQGDVTKLDQMGLGEFDYIFCLAVMEHIKDDIGLLRQMQSMLRPGGYFVMQVPSADRRTVAEKEEADGHERPGYHYAEVPKILSSAGLRPTKQRTMDPYGLMYYWSSWSRPGSKRYNWRFATFAPFFITAIRVTSALNKRPGAELGFMAVKEA